jgi:dipeptidyl aminopeptidase/acylaminoacyl peptidase
VYLGALDKRTPIRVVESDGPAVIAAPDRLLTIRQGALLAYNFDPRSGAVQGEPVVVAQGFMGASASSGFAASDTGVLAYRAGTAQRRQLTWVDRKGATVRTIGEPQSDFIAAPELSADEQSVVVYIQRNNDNDVWIIELGRNLARRLTNGPPADAQPMWDPDGQHVVFFSRRFGGGGPARVSLTGAEPAPMFPKGESGLPQSWTKDRGFVLMRRVNPKTGADLIAVPTKGDPTEIVVAQSHFEESEGQFSPDGKWVAFVSNEGGRQEVFLQSFPDARTRTQVSTGGGSQIRWSADGKEIFYIAPDEKMMSATIEFSGIAPQVKLPVALFQTHLASGTNVLGTKPQYAVARDGRFLLNVAIESVGSPIVVGVNWMKK